MSGNPLIRKHITGWHVKVEPKQSQFVGFFAKTRLEEAARRLSMAHDTCKEMVDQIRRHVDDVDRVTVEEEFELLCADCGYAWIMPEDSPHNDGCCDADCDRKEAANSER